LVFEAKYTFQVISKQAYYQISIIRSRTLQATNTSTTMNDANVAYVLLTYSMESATLTIESNSK